MAGRPATKAKGTATTPSGGLTLGQLEKKIAKLNEQQMTRRNALADAKAAFAETTTELRQAKAQRKDLVAAARRATGSVGSG